MQLRMCRLFFQAPSYVNCADLHSLRPYKLRTPAVTKSFNYRYTRINFYVDSEETFTVSVWARNSEVFLSEPTTLTVTSPLLREFSCPANEFEIDLYNPVLRSTYPNTHAPMYLRSCFYSCKVRLTVKYMFPYVKISNRLIGYSGQTGQFI